MYASESLGEKFCEKIFAWRRGSVKPLDEGLEGKPVRTFDFYRSGVWKEYK